MRTLENDEVGWDGIFVKGFGISSNIIDVYSIQILSMYTVIYILNY